jgi:hypothetical protein
MTWWDDFWRWAETSQLGSNVVGGLIVALVVAVAALVVSFAKASWRDKIWGSVARLFRWLGTIRVTTTARQEAMVNEARGSWTELMNNVTGQLKAAVAAKEAAEAAARAKAQAPAPKRDVWDEVVAVPYLPPPMPRWAIWSAHLSETSRDFVLQNAVKRSVAREVRIESSTGRFRFLDGAHWEELSGEAQGKFRGEVDDMGWEYGLTFEVTWYDAQGLKHEESVTMPPPAKEDEY